MNKPTTANEIDGLDESEGVGWGEYPLDSVFVRTETRTVSEIIKRIKAGRYELNPEFQRDFVWPVGKQSRLIESALMRIPLPVFYVAEAKDGRIIVVDGLQRLTTFHRFVNNNFALTSLGDGEGEEEKQNPLIGKKFHDLPVNLQERIEDTQLTLYILDAKAPERAKLDIFERVNGGVPLTRQQMRNCLYNGAATHWLKEAAKGEAFLTVTDGKLDSRAMRDREAINRFCAFRILGFSAYKGGMDTFLADALEKMNHLRLVELDSMMTAFEHSMRWNRRLFEKHAFRKSLADSDKHVSRKPINFALFDVCSVLFADLPKELDERAVQHLQQGFRGLFDDSEFVSSITYATNDSMRVRTRFNKATQAIQKALTTC